MIPPDNVILGCPSLGFVKSGVVSLVNVSTDYVLIYHMVTMSKAVSSQGYTVYTNSVWITAYCIYYLRMHGKVISFNSCNS